MVTTIVVNPKNLPKRGKMSKHSNEFKRFTDEILKMPEEKFLEGLLAIISTYYPEQDKTLPREMQVPENLVMSAMLIAQRIKEIENAKK